MTVTANETVSEIVMPPFVGQGILEVRNRPSLQRQKAAG